MSRISRGDTFLRRHQSPALWTDESELHDIVTDTEALRKLEKCLTFQKTGGVYCSDCHNSPRYHYGRKQTDQLYFIFVRFFDASLQLFATEWDM